MTSISLLLTTAKDNGEETILKCFCFCSPIKRESENKMIQSGRQRGHIEEKERVR